MHTVTAGFLASAEAAANRPNFSALISWLKNYDEDAQFFTIGTSAIESMDIIASGGGTAAFFDKYDYTLETEQVNSFTVERTISTIPIGIMSAQLDIEFDNTSKRYLPTYDPTIGDYIKPGRPIRVNAGFDFEMLPQFVGYTGRPILTLGNRVLQYHAFDAITYLNSTKSELDPIENVTANEAIEELLIEAGFAADQYELDASTQSELLVVNPKGEMIGEVIREIVEAEQGIFFFDENGIARFWNRLHIDLNSTSVGELSYDNSLDLKYVDTPVINHVRVNANPRRVETNELLYTLPTPITLAPGTTTEFIGSMTDDDGPLPVKTIDTPGYLAGAGLSSYATNTQADGSGSTVGTVTVDPVEVLGTSFKITFDNPTGGVVYVTALTLYGDAIKVYQRITQEYRDEASIEENGLNPDNGNEVMVFENNYIQGTSEAFSFAFNTVDQFSQPRRQITAPIFPNPAYQFGDVLTLNLEDTGEVIKCVILGNRLTLSNADGIHQDLTLEGRTFSTLFTIGVSAIEGADAIAL